MQSRSAVAIASASLAGLIVASPATQAQVPARDTYLNSIPHGARIVTQTAASERLHLFGNREDPAYRDVEPVDGIDDSRAHRFLLLGERFSPLLRRNTFSTPHDFVALLGDRHVLEVDVWSEGKRVRSRSIDLRPCQGGPASDAQANSAPARCGAADDTALDSLIREFHPRVVRPGFTRPEGEAETVMFFDFPGADERSWRAMYAKSPLVGARLHLHPFVYEQPHANWPARYALVLQYWMFYPYNDGPNNHEGDWEHINVIVSTRERIAATDGGDALLDAREIDRIVGGLTPLDSLIISSVNYYFHHNVMTLSYNTRVMQLTPALRDGAIDTRNHVWQDEDFIEKTIARRLSFAGGRLATHPVGYIGGDNMGPDELLVVRPRFGGSYGRDSHGTYPFPGTWKAFGPADATEKIFGDVVPRLKRHPRDSSAPEPEWHELIADKDFLTFRASDLILLPDWERIQDLVFESAEVRRRFGWMLLPIRFGFPTSPSPGAGAIARADLGNSSPIGPSFNPGWNRLGATSEHPEYTPRVLRIALAPVTPFTTMRTGWGVLNLPLVALGLLPGYNVAITQLLPWLTGALNIMHAPPANTFFPGELPARFTSVGVGGYAQFGGADFARLLPQREHSAVADVLTSAPGVFVDVESLRRRRNGGGRLFATLYYGNWFAVENTLSTDTSEVRYLIRGAAGEPLGTVRGRFALNELLAAFVYRPSKFGGTPVRPFVRAGYGWTWYTLREMTLNGEPFGPVRMHGGYAPPILPSRKWWPNTVHAGAGVELFTPKKYWIVHRLGYGVRLEMNGLLHHLSNDGPCPRRCDARAERFDSAISILFGW